VREFVNIRLILPVSDLDEGLGVIYVAILKKSASVEEAKTIPGLEQFAILKLKVDEIYDATGCSHTLLIGADIMESKEGRLRDQHDSL
jgi:hypothetical protein